VTVVSPRTSRSLSRRAGIELYAGARNAQGERPTTRGMPNPASCAGEPRRSRRRGGGVSPIYERGLRVPSPDRRLGDNERLSRAYERENVHTQIARVHYRRTMRDLDVTQQEHEAIMVALERRDATAARAAMDTHLVRAKAAILADMDVAMDDAGAATARASRSPA